jgi:hypothetical protein
VGRTVGEKDGGGEALSPPPEQPDWGNMQKWRSMHHRGVKREFYLIHVACTIAGKKGTSCPLPGSKAAHSFVAT